jgi:hypothetical protein
MVLSAAGILTYDLALEIRYRSAFTNERRADSADSKVSLAYGDGVRNARMGTSADWCWTRCPRIIVDRRLTGTIAMIRAAQNAVYNLRIAEMRIPWSGCRSRVLSLTFLICFCWSAASYAAGLKTSAEELAKRIAGGVGAGNIALTLTNASSLTPKDSEEVDRNLRLRLAAAGVHVVKPEQAATSVDVTLSENTQSFVWVAVVHQGTSEPRVAIMAVPRTETSAPIQELPPLALRKTLLWTQERQILDLLVLESANPAPLLVLDSENVGIYRAASGRWQQEQLLPIAHSMPWPRDLRGRLALRADRVVDAYLPGVSCQVSIDAAVVMNCRESNDPWLVSSLVPVGAFFAPPRNFFTGVLAPGIGHQTSVSKFYTVAPVARQSSTVWLTAATDGNVHLLDGSTEQTLSVRWGSDLASVRSSCGSGWQILSSSRGLGSGDSIKAYEMPDQEPVPVSVAADFAGPVTALWTEASGTSAIAVSKNVGTGNYEAYRLAVACGR